MKTKGFIVAAVALTVMTLPLAQTHTAPAEIKAQLETDCNNTVTAAMQKLRPHLGDYAMLRDKPHLVLVMPVANFNAFADHSNQRILIPVMLCIETWYLLDGMMQVSREPRLQGKMQQYVAYLSRRQRDSLAKGTGFDNVPLQPFHEFAGVAYPQLSDAGIQKGLGARESIIVESMAFIIGHEFAHLALQHKPYNTISAETARKQEFDADEFSARLLTKAGISVLAAMPIIHRFLTNELSHKRVVGGSMTHPRPECRMERIVSSTNEIQELLKNADRRREYETASGYSADDFSKTMEGLREDCQRNPLGGTPLARIIMAQKDDFASLRTGHSERIEGEQSWEATVSLDGDRSCTVWAGSRDSHPRVHCPVGRTTKDDSLALRNFSEALGIVQSTIPGDWGRTESPLGNRGRMKEVTYTGPEVRIRITLSRYERSGNNDVRVVVYATK